MSRSGAGGRLEAPATVAAGDIGLGYCDPSGRNLSNKLWAGTMGSWIRRRSRTRSGASIPDQPDAVQAAQPALLTSILRGELAPGNALPSEDDLASQFDVSRPVVREAVKELAVLGLVESRQGRSTRVTRRTTGTSSRPSS